MKDAVQISLPDRSKTMSYSNGHGLVGSYNFVECRLDVFIVVYIFLCLAGCKVFISEVAYNYKRTAILNTGHTGEERPVQSVEPCRRSFRLCKCPCHKGYLSH